MNVRKIGKIAIAAFLTLTAPIWIIPAVLMFFAYAFGCMTHKILFGEDETPRAGYWQQNRHHNHGGTMNFLGKTASDRITGFKGIITGHVHYLSGCSQLLLVPPVDKDGKIVEPQWFDEQRVVIQAEVAPIELNNGPTPGFDKAAPKR